MHQFHYGMNSLSKSVTALHLPPVIGILRHIISDVLVSQIHPMITRTHSADYAECFTNANTELTEAHRTGQPTLYRDTWQQAERHTPLLAKPARTASCHHFPSSVPASLLPVELEASLQSCASLFPPPAAFYHGQPTAARAPNTTILTQQLDVS